MSMTSKSNLRTTASENSSTTASNASSNLSLFSLSTDLAMSTSHLAGDAAPLPSPTSQATSTATYFQHPIPPQAQHPLFGRQSQLPPQQQQQHPTSSQHPTQPKPARQPHAPKPSFSSTSTQPAQPQPPIQEQPSQEQSQQPPDQPRRADSESSTNSETSLHLQNATLLAEAAGRAQMGCAERDFGEMEL